MTRADHTKGAEDLLRDVMGDPAYDVTPDGDPLAPVWRKARAIRRRRSLAAGGTAAVVIAAAVVTGIAVTGQDAKRGPAFITPPSATASVAPPSLVPTTTPSAPTPSTGPSSASSAPPVQTTFKRTAIALENPVGTGAYVAGTETSEGGQSFRVVLLDTNTGAAYRSEWVPGEVGGFDLIAGGLWATVKGTHTVVHTPVPLLDPGFSPGALPLVTITDERGVVTGPVVSLGSSAWIADAKGIATIDDQGNIGATIADSGRVCEMTSSPTGLYVVGGPRGGACISATAIDTAKGTSTDVADARDSSLGLRGLAPDSEGFWVEQPSGMMGSYEHVHFVPSSGQLPVVAPAEISGSNGMQISIVRNHAWISDPGTLQCADVFGHVLWQKELPPDVGAAHVFATPNGAVLVTNTYAEPFDTSVCQ